MKKFRDFLSNSFSFPFQILPGLQAFCATCALAIGSIYLLQASWFVAWLSIDQKRIEARKDGMLPCCIVHKGGSGSTGIENENQATISNANTNATNTPTTPSSMNTTSNVTSSAAAAAVSEKTWNRRILEWAAHLISYRLFKVSLLVVG